MKKAARTMAGKTGLFYRLFPVLVLLACSSPSPIPPGFVRLASLDASIQHDIRYAGSNNFIGRPIAAYLAPSCVLSLPAAQGLVQAQQLAVERGFSLKVYDCYRPQTAVDDFVAWAQDADAKRMKAHYYPAVPKQELFSRGYIAERSGHSRGSTVDLTLVPLGSNLPVTARDAASFDCRAGVAGRYPDNSLDMGTGYDCFDALSHTDNPAVGAAALANRHLLREIMQAAGFVNYDQEWWHYTLQEEAYPDSYFSFPVQ